MTSRHTTSAWCYKQRHFSPDLVPFDRVPRLFTLALLLSLLLLLLSSNTSSQKFPADTLTLPLTKLVPPPANRYSELFQGWNPLS
jgi:hypothetical protein